MGAMNKLHDWHQTKRGLFIVALIELVIAYIFISIAIDSANLWAYAVGIVSGVGAIHNLIKSAGVRNKGAKKAR